MSTTTISEYKKPLHRRDNSGELDVFEAARYFSGYNDNNNVLVGDDEENAIKKGKQGKLRPRGASLDMPSFKQSHQYYYKEYHQNYTLARLDQHHQNQPQQPPPQQQQQQQRQQIMKENKKFKQPSSPGGFQTPKITPYTINSTPTKTYQNVKSFQDYKQVLATLSKYKIQEKELAKISKDAKVIRGDDYYYTNNNRRNYEEIKKINEDKMDDYEDVESDASSDLFELQIDDEFTFCSSGLPVYESTHMENIKQTSATAK
ncbi:uncharacterized protein LOC141644078 [Silene latifolia]|uniref:uncharacterized protein LOC141644078 n=1 Tax=Silene latifolia TaxID=37657 RepID=UPI003D772D30